MNGVASTLNDDQMRKLSKYFASQKGIEEKNLFAK